VQQFNLHLLPGETFQFRCASKPADDARACMHTTARVCSTSAPDTTRMLPCAPALHAQAAGTPGSTHGWSGVEPARWNAAQLALLDLWRHALPCWLPQSVAHLRGTRSTDDSGDRGLQASTHIASVHAGGVCCWLVAPPLLTVGGLRCRVFHPPEGEPFDLVDVEAEARLLASTDTPACPSEVQVGAWTAPPHGGGCGGCGVGRIRDVGG
jgi:hypothetical protein